ncbi:HlyD family secretion protein [Magnetospirillum molischianum]|uniref:Multidrug resistance efflux pump n=1 Tax=Magnetospirillum molischianum DSM 120 TaxID=1150626 RepID=H8FT12_MAGML|nr:HlyD family secretion protein [Magnetospirillum molischianum]CCG41500.1 Multidrug resistance efflux pump [Magnetospirillum molischianum DSM 120]
MKKPAIITLALIAAATGSWAAYSWAVDWRWIETTDDAYVEGDITPIQPKVPGHVVLLNAEDNRSVAKGDILIRIDDRDYRARVEQARAVLVARRASLIQLDQKIAVQEAVIVQSGASVASARAEVARARADHERTSRLVREDFVSRQRFDTTQADAAKAEAGLAGSGAQAQAARRQLAVLVSERAIAEAEADQAQAALDLAEIDLEATVIRASVDGMVGNRAVREGQYVRTGQTLLAVVPLASVWVDANYKETQLSHIRPGQRATINVDAYGGREIEGRVDSIAPASGARFSLLPPENATGNFTKVVQRVPVRLRFATDNSLAGLLRPGLSVTARIDTREPPR